MKRISLFRIIIATVFGLIISCCASVFASYIEDFETYPLEDSSADIADDIPYGWFNDNGTPYAWIGLDPVDSSNQVYWFNISPYGSTMFGGDEFGDFDITFKFYKTGYRWWDDLNFMFRCSPDLDNYYYPNGYWIRIQGSQIRFSPRNLGTISYSVVANTWHTMRVKAEGNHFEVYLNGDLIFDIIDEDNLYERGLIGFRTERHLAAVDDISLLVVDPIENINDLIELVIALELPAGIKQSLTTKLEGALTALMDENSSNDVVAINKLEAFILQIEALSGNKISAAIAVDLVELTNDIIESL
jgi:hypothetical protein